MAKKKTAKFERRVKGIKRSARKQGKEIVSGEAGPGEVNPWAVAHAAKKKAAKGRSSSRKKHKKS